MGSVYQAAYDAAGDMTCRAPTSSQTCAGNPSSFTGQQLGYDNEGRLTTWANSYTVPTASDTFLYDGEGNRIEQVVQTTSSKTDTVYVGKLEQVTITTPTGGQPTTSTLAYYGGVAVAVNGVLSYLGSDQLGSAEVALDSNGNVIASQLFTPYGNTRYSSGVFPTQQAFTGYLADSATGLDYANARYYDPAAGAFISADATGGSGLNRYAYAGDNPETFTDPSGLIITCANGCPLSGSLQDPQYRMFVIALALSNELEPGTGMPYLLYFKIYEPQVYSIVHAYAEQHGIDLDMYAAYQAIKFRASKPESYWKDHPEEYYAVTTAGIGVAILQTGSAGNGSLNQLYGSVEYDDAFVELPNELNVDEGVIDENPDDSSPLLKRPEESSGGNGDTGGDNGGGSGCGESFAPNTPVATPHGAVAIGKLKVGQQVVAYDPAAKKTSTQTVQHVFIDHDTDLLDVTLRSTPTRGPPTSLHSQHGQAAKQATHDETVHTTASHPWLSADRGWVRAGTLHLGEQALRADGTTATVVGLRVVVGAASMWDLTVSHIHTFAVGAGQFVVHNCASGGGDNGNGDTTGSSRPRGGGQSTKPTTPALPSGAKNTSDFGKRIMQWGGNAAEARAAIGTLDKDVLESNGMTPEIADAWADFYAKVQVWTPDNPSAAGREDLMRWTANLLRGGGTP